MLVRPAVRGNQVRRVGRHPGARTDVAARLEIGDMRGRSNLRRNTSRRIKAGLRISAAATV